MSKQHYQTLFAYSWHTVQQLLDKAALLDDADLRARTDFGHGSIYDIFFHLLATSHGWRLAVETGVQPRRLQPDGFASLDAVAAGLTQEAERWQTWLASQSDAQIDGTLTLTTRRGESAVLECWRVLQHLTLHAMQHHTELAALLTNQGQSPGDIDFIFYAG